MTERSKAVILMLASAAAFAVMSALVKAVPDVPVIEKVLFRNLITLGIAGAIAVKSGRRLLGAWRHQPLLIARSLLGIGGVICFFYAVDNLILADAAMLTKLSPFFVAVFAYFFLGERPSRIVTAAMVVGFFGGVLVIKPRFESSVIPALIGAASAVFAGGAYTAVRSLRTREAPETIIFHFSLVTVVGLGLIGSSDFHAPNATEWLWLSGIGIFAAAGQFGLTFAYRHAPAAQVSIYSYATILFSAALGLAAWGEVPDLLSGLGGLLIIGGGVMAYLGDRETRVPVASDGGPDENLGALRVASRRCARRA